MFESDQMSGKCEAVCHRLRYLVGDAIEKGLFNTAVFYADKLVDMSGKRSEDVLLLARSYYLTGNFNRCFSLIEKSDFIAEARRIKSTAISPGVKDELLLKGWERANIRTVWKFVHLAAQCLV
jgi:hypothetical protein